jgi:hypothetical protein
VLLFLSNLNAFYVFSPLFYCYKLQNTVEKKWWEQASLSCFWSQEERIQSFIMKRDALCKYFAVSFDRVETSSFPILIFWEFCFLSQEWVLNLFKCFLYLWKWSYGFCLLLYYYCELHGLIFQIINQPWISGVKSTWPWCIILLVY